MSKKEFTKKQLRKQLSTLTESKGNIKSELKAAYKALKKLKQTLIGHKTGEDTLTFTDLKKIKNAARNIEDIYEDMVDTEMDEKDEEEVKKVEKKNEQSEGHGKMYNALSGIKEGKVIKMNESTLRRVVDRVIKEQGQGQGGTMSPEEFEKMLGASARYNKYHDSIESNIKANYTAINNMAGAIDKNFNVVGKILQGLHKGKKVGAQFIQNTLLAMGLANMVKK